MRILQLVGRIFGISNSKEFGLNFDSFMYVVGLIWFGGCAIGVHSYGVQCTSKKPDMRVIILTSGSRLIHLGMLITLIRFRFTNMRANQILCKSSQLGEINSEFILLGYRRRNFVIITVTLMWTLSKIMQMQSRKDDGEPNCKELYYCKVGCTVTNKWPLMILSGQFLVWMQIFSRTFLISSNELRFAIIRSRQAPPATAHEAQITKYMYRLKTVLNFKETILHVYGFSIVINQLQSILWIILNAYWYSSYQGHYSELVYFTLMVLFNMPMSFLPHWAGQEISSEVSKHSVTGG